MPKYYVQSGRTKEIVVADDGESAARQVVQAVRYDLSRLGLNTTVSETGFAITDDTLVAATKQLIDSAGEARRST